MPGFCAKHNRYYTERQCPCCSGSELSRHDATPDWIPKRGIVALWDTPPQQVTSPTSARPDEVVLLWSVPKEPARTDRSTTIVVRDERAAIREFQNTLENQLGEHLAVAERALEEAQNNDWEELEDVVLQYIRKVEDARDVRDAPQGSETIRPTTAPIKTSPPVPKPPTGKGRRLTQKSTWDDCTDAFYSDSTQNNWLADMGTMKPAFPIVAGENGETYHALVACLILASPRLDVQEASEPQKALLRYYLTNYSNRLCVSSGNGSKPEATAIIERFFGSFCAQDQLFAHNALLKMMDAANSESVSDVVWPILTKYLRESRQIERALLRKLDGNERAALVTVRRTTKATDGRFMDEFNLKQVLLSIISVNEIAEKIADGLPKGNISLKDQRIAQVILYGDVGDVANDPELKIHIKVLAEHRIECICIPSPFSAAGKKSAALQDFLKSRWPPPEVLVLGIYISLKRLYERRIFAVGFRSGTLDGAGFLGIPIIYFDDTTWTAKDSSSRAYENGTYLYRRDTNATERMLAVSNSLSTFIRINHAPNKTRQTSGPYSGKDIMHLDKLAIAQFRMAVLLWIMCTDTKGQPLWSHRAETLDLTSLPAWWQAVVKYLGSAL